MYGDPEGQAVTEKVDMGSSQTFIAFDNQQLSTYRETVPSDIGDYKISFRLKDAAGASSKSSIQISVVQSSTPNTTATSQYIE